MPVGYVLVLALVAGGTAVSLLPPPRDRRLGIAAFRLSLVVNELPQVAFVLLLASTALSMAQDDLLASTTGRWLLAAAAATSVGLAAIAHRSGPAGPVVDHAVADALGTPSHRAVGSAPALRRAAGTVAPYPARPRDVERIADVPYGDAGRRHLLDVYRSATPTTDAPVLVYFHGGGYASGDKHREARALLHRLAAEGWVCISANYRLRPQAQLAEHLADARRAIAWVRANGPEYGADPTTLVVAGSSAGAHLAALVALGPTGPEQAGPRVSGAVCLYGYYGPYYDADPGAWPPSAPIACDASVAPPFFVAHGDRDSYVPVEHARAFVAHLRATSPHPVVYAELPGGQHAFDLFRSSRSDAVADGVVSYLAWLRGA